MLLQGGRQRDCDCAQMSISCCFFFHTCLPGLFSGPVNRGPTEGKAKIKPFAPSFHHYLFPPCFCKGHLEVMLRHAWLFLRKHFLSSDLLKIKGHQSPAFLRLTLIWSPWMCVFISGEWPLKEFVITVLHCFLFLSHD